MENKTDTSINAILQKGVDFKVTYKKPNLWQKALFPKGRTFVIYPATLGTLLKVSVELSQVKDFNLAELTDSDMIKASINSALKYKDNYVKAIAFAIVNKNKEPEKRLIRFLDANLTAQEALHLIAVVLSQLGAQDFLSGMVLASRTNIVKTNSTPGAQSAGS